jgi:hypothetical protein
MVHPSFLVGEAGGWIRAFTAAAKAKDANVTLFQRDRDRFQDFSLIHCFGFGHFELLYNLQKQGIRTLVTPHFLPPSPRGWGERGAEFLLRAARSFGQRSLTPLDQFFFLRSADGYLFRGEGHEAWARSWKIPQASWQSMSASAVAAASDAFKIYSETQGAG